MKYFLMIVTGLILFMNQACDPIEEVNPEIAFDEATPIGLALDTLNADSTGPDTVSVIRNVDLKIYKGTNEVKEIVVRFWDSSFASVKADSLLGTLPVYEKHIRPTLIDPFSLFTKERLSFAYYPKRNRLVKYNWRIYVIDSKGNSSNTLEKSLVVKFR